MEQTRVRIGGQLVGCELSVEVRNPYDATLLAAVPQCGPDEVDRACSVAAAVLARQRRGAEHFPQHRRAAVLDRTAALLAERVEEFAQRITAEAGKPIRSSRHEVARCVDTLAFAAAQARLLCGEMVAMEASEPGAGRVGFALRLPIGVVAAITPFNFPLNLVAHKVAPAIAAGCAVVLKPAPQTPLTAIAFVELLVEAGLPADWISVLTDSGREAAEPLVVHPVPSMITFTGSVAVGWSIAAAAPRKRVALELGSNAPVIVEPDADLAAVASKVRTAGFAFAGQSCIAVQRVIVQRGVHAQLVDLLAREVADIVVGDPRDEATEVGPLISARETERVLTWVERAAAGGAQVVAGGKLDDGILLPTVIDTPPLDAEVCRSEVFGPVVVVLPYDQFEDALRIANSTDYALQAGVFTNDLGKAMRAVRELDFGGVLVNEVPTVRVDQQPYGGVRDAGNTREGPAHAVLEMTELRFVSLPMG